MATSVTSHTGETLTVGQLAERLRALPADAPVAVDDGREFRAAFGVAPSRLALIDDQEHEHPVLVLVLMVARDGRSLDEALARATPLSGRQRARNEVL